MEKPITNVLREKIKMYIKNKIDISPLIKNMSIKDENLSGAIIKDIYRVNTNISNCNFSNATIGSDDKIATFLGCNMVNCNFEGTNFVGKTWIRNCDARNCNFKNSNVSLVDYRFTDFTGSTFCYAIIRIGSKTGLGCKFPKEMFYDLTKNWKMGIKVFDKDEKDIEEPKDFQE
jgi:uncharacterized protein YjbI with pentapeptide repeats